MSTTAITPTISSPSRVRRASRSLKGVFDEMVAARELALGRTKR